FSKTFCNLMQDDFGRCSHTLWSRDEETGHRQGCKGSGGEGNAGIPPIEADAGGGSAGKMSQMVLEKPGKMSQSGV
ncbi:hypothetical protein, partial [Faecalibaculum rodentium]|uniref:hypothetical protein n=2 Tax=Faecalibaculum rodentium TaxID=1702221 RepID=UPI00272B7D38